MKQKLRIKVSKKKEEGSLSLRKLRIREKILKFFLGNTNELTVFFPGKDVSEILIQTEEKGEKDAKEKVTV